jgi:hypothetical protein
VLGKRKVTVNKTNTSETKTKEMGNTVQKKNTVGKYKN